MYKKDLHRIEDSIFPLILEGLLLCQIKQTPEVAACYEKALKILGTSYLKDLNTAKLLRRAERIEKKVLKHWNSSETVVRKSIMELSHLVKTIKKQDGFVLAPEVDQVFKEIDEIITDGCKKEDIRKQDKSAAKQAPKVFKILQEEGLF
jgi:alpha-D-ribose 1-methylphosphonate 5-triphosphate synthase subunit PhnI